MSSGTPCRWNARTFQGPLDAALGLTLTSGDVKYFCGPLVKIENHGAHVKHRLDKGLVQCSFLGFVHHPVLIAPVSRTTIRVEMLGSWCDPHTGFLACGVNAICNHWEGKHKGLNFPAPGQGIQ